MDSNIPNEESKGVRGLISVMGLLVVIIGMVASVQSGDSMIPPIMIILGTIIILVAEKTRLDER